MMIPENIILKVVLKILQANLGNQVVHGVDSVLEHGVLDPVGTKLNMQNHWKCNFPMNPLMSGCCLLDGRSIDIGRFVDRFVIKGRGRHMYQNIILDTTKTEIPSRFYLCYATRFPIKDAKRLLKYYKSIVFIIYLPCHHYSM